MNGPRRGLLSVGLLSVGLLSMVGGWGSRGTPRSDV